MTDERAQHRALARQLRRFGLAAAEPPDARGWRTLLEAVSRAYHEADDDRYLLERSIEVSSEEMRALHDELSRQARTDTLTGLPNRAELLDVLAGLLSGARDDGPRPAVLFIDLDGFKAVNDSWGHRVGDELLVRAAERIRSCVHAEDVVGRLGGDEFVVVAVAPDSAEQPLTLGASIVASLADPFRIGSHDVRIGASVGVAPGDGVATAADLLQRADIAMYDAKLSGKGVVRLFDEEMRRRTTERISLEGALREALERDELALHYQPIVRTRDGALVGVEALVRWDRPGQGLVPAVEFVGVAEETRLITQLDAWVLNRACRDAVQWPHEVRVAVNFSPRDLALEDLSDRVAAALARHRLPARRLTVELTEGALLDRRPAVDRNLERLRALGVAFAVDDFGTGYSSLAYLRHLPVETVKVDRSFLADVESQPADRAVVGAVVSMCHALGLAVVAEGVERPGQLDVLRDLGVDLAQGYLFSQPMTHPQLIAHLVALPPGGALSAPAPALPRPRRRTAVVAS